MIVVCKNNIEMDPILEIGKKYLVNSVKCIDNQLYFSIEGVNRLCLYWRFGIVSELRNDKLNDLGI